MQSISLDDSGKERYPALAHPVRRALPWAGALTMSHDTPALDTGQLAEALLLADAEDRQSLDDLRRLLAALLPWPRPDQDGAAEAAIRECLALLDGAEAGDAGSELGHLASILAPVLAPAQQAQPAPQEQAPAQPVQPTPRDHATAPNDAAALAAKTREKKAPRREETTRDETTRDGSSTAIASLADDPELVTEFIENSREQLDEADALLLTLENDKDDREAVNSIFRVFHTIKGMAGFLAFKEIEEAAHDTESRLDAVRKDSVALDREMMDSLFAAVDTLRDLVGAAGTPAADAAPATRDESRDAPQDEPGKADLADAPAPEDERREASRPAAAAKVRGTVHVDEDRLDRLLDIIGELVIAEASVSQSVRTLAGASDTVATDFNRLDKISRQLQEMATSMRMVPFRTTMRRMARLVRDLSRESGKRVKCVLEGEEIELDKHVVDRIADPLIHLVRNAVDHGIEADLYERVRAGKPKVATVRLSARHAGGRIVIEVADDGRGIDAAAVVRKAREMGIVGPDETPSPEAVPQLIFAPGFSTARMVTGVSGRGVGMDVVKRVVDGLLGSIAIISTPGQGTLIRLTLPLTLAIIDGMLVRVGSERYIIPALSIVRSLRLEPHDVTGVLGQAEMLSTQHGLVPLVRLARLFATDGDSRDAAGPEATAAKDDDLVTIVSEADGSSLTGLVVSELLGQQQIVMKSLGTGLGEVPGVSGAAILPDGTVGLIIDVQQTVRLAHERKG
jgi:two-component system, chemotaxis family, sensor kinase CheA